MAFYKAFYYGYKNVKKKAKVLEECTDVGDDCISAPSSISSLGRGNPEDINEDYVLRNQLRMVLRNKG